MPMTLTSAVDYFARRHHVLMSSDIEGIRLDKPYQERDDRRRDHLHRGPEGHPSQIGAIRAYAVEILKGAFRLSGKSVVVGNSPAACPPIAAAPSGCLRRQSWANSGSAKTQPAAIEDAQVTMVQGSERVVGVAHHRPGCFNQCG